MGKKILALEVSRNGERLCLAGLGAGVVTASVGAANRAVGQESSIDLTVSGFQETAAVFVHPWWIGDPRLRLGDGDAIMIRVVIINESEVDPPAQIRRASKPRRSARRR